MLKRSRSKSAASAVRLDGTSADTATEHRGKPPACVAQYSARAQRRATRAHVERYRDTERAAASSSAPAARNGARTGAAFAGAVRVAGQSGAGLVAPLGIVTRNSSPPVTARVCDVSTGEILEPVGRAVGRAARWELKASADSIRPSTRTSKCCKFLAPTAGAGLQYVGVMRSERHRAAHYSGLMQCGSVWHCPICAAKIAERRRAELVAAVQTAIARGWRVHFVTLTVPHGAGDDVSAMLDKLSKALQLMSSGNKSGLKHHLLAVDERAKILGYIRALEVTHGKHGWHPHYHLILFTPRGIDCSVVQWAYERAWLSACRRAGLPEPSRMWGVKVQDGREAARYASKWGIEDEMTRSHAKQSRAKGLSPWGFLRVFAGAETHEDYSPGRAAALFREYAQAFRGRRQLHWSVGLRALLCMSQELSDQELAEQEQDASAVLLGALSLQQWRSVRRARAQCAVLEAAEVGWASFVYLVEKVTGSPPCDQFGLRDLLTA